MRLTLAMVSRVVLFCDFLGSYARVKRFLTCVAQSNRSKFGTSDMNKTNARTISGWKPPSVATILAEVRAKRLAGNVLAAPALVKKETSGLCFFRALGKKLEVLIAWEHLVVRRLPMGGQNITTLPSAAPRRHASVQRGARCISCVPPFKQAQGRMTAEWWALGSGLLLLGLK